MGRDGKVQDVQIGLVPSVAQASEPLGQGFLQRPEFLLALRQVVDGPVAGASAAYLLDPGRDFQQAFLGAIAATASSASLSCSTASVTSFPAPRARSSMPSSLGMGSSGNVRIWAASPDGLRSRSVQSSPPVLLSGC